MGSVFGPFYPTPLQLSVNHAERFTNELRRHERELCGSRWFEAAEASRGERWILGRADEVEAFAADVIREWRAKSISIEIAASVIAGYLLDLHSAYSSELGVLSPECCDERAKRTIASGEIPTAVAPSPASRTHQDWTRLVMFSANHPPTPTPSTPA